MSIEKSTELLNIDVPKITYQHIRDLIASIKAQFKDKRNNEAWMQSTNPDALLIKNLDILYQDNYGDIRNGGLCSPKVVQKFLRLVFKRAEGGLAKRRKTPLVVFPHAIEYLKTQFDPDVIDKIQSQYKQHQEKLESIPIQNLECIDGSLKDKKESKEFTNFIANAKNVYVSTDEEKIQLLLEAIKNPTFYDHEIFKDPNVLFYAMAACRRGEISPMQYAGLSQWIELRKVYSEEDVEIYPLFDDKGEFKKEAKEHFLKYIYNKKIMRSSKKDAEEFEDYFLTEHNLDAFKEKLKQLPLSDQILIKVRSANKGYTRDINFAYYGSAPNSVLFGDTTERLSLLSLNVYQCLIDTAFPSHPTKLEPCLSVGIKDVENSSRKNKRDVIVYYPRPKQLKANAPKAQFFHKTGAQAVAWIGSHDVFHAMLMSNINQVAFSKLGLTLDVIRSYTQKNAKQTQVTTGLWHLADAAYGGVTDKLSPSEAFLKIISIAYQHDSDTFQLEMAAIFLDIYFNPDKWGNAINFNNLVKEKNISGKFLLGNSNLGIHLDCIKEYLSFFNKDDDPKVNLFKAALIYEGIESNRSRNEIEFLLSFNYIPEDISFKTIKKSSKINDKEELTNFSYVHLHGKLFDKKAYYELLHSSSISFDRDKQKYDINKQNDESETLLHFLAKAPEISIQEIHHLIESGADIYIKDKRNNTALHYLILNKKWDEYKHFLKNENIDLDFEFKGSSWMLHEAVKNNDMEFVKYLLENKKLDINKLDKSGKAPLYYALKGPWHGGFKTANMKLIEYLISKGATDNEVFKLLFDQCLNYSDIIIDEKSSITQNFLNLFDKISLEHQLDLLIGHTNLGLDHKSRIQSMMINFGDIIALLKKLTKEKKVKLIDDSTWGVKIASLIQSKEDYLEITKLLSENFFNQYRVYFLKDLKNIELMKYLIDINRIDANQEMDFLSDVFCSKNVEIIKYMLEETNIDLGVKNKIGNTPMYYCNYREMTVRDLISFFENNKIDLSKSISLRNYLPSLIKDSADLSLIMHYLPENERLAFWKKHSNSLALDFSHFDKQILTSEKIHFDIKLGLIDQYINSSNFNFWNFLNYLKEMSPKPDQYDRIFQIESLKDKINLYQLKELLKQLGEDQIVTLLQINGWMSKIISFMSSIEQFLQIGKFFPDNQQLKNTLRDHAASLIKNSYDLFTILKFYSENEQWGFWEKNRDALKLDSDGFNYHILLSEKIDFKIKLVQINKYIDSKDFKFETFLDYLKYVDILLKDNLSHWFWNIVSKTPRNKIELYKFNKLFGQLSTDQRNILIQDPQWDDHISLLIFKHFIRCKNKLDVNKFLSILNGLPKNDSLVKSLLSAQELIDNIRFSELKQLFDQLSGDQKCRFVQHPDWNKKIKSLNPAFFINLCNTLIPNKDVLINIISNNENIKFVDLLPLVTLKNCFPEIQQNISDSIIAGNNFSDPKIKKIALFASLKVYLSELASVERPNYRPTLFGMPLPSEAIEAMPEFLLGVSKEKKLAAGEALKEAELNNASLNELYNNPAYSGALSQGDLGKIFDALKSVEEEILTSGIRSNKKI